MKSSSVVTKIDSRCKCFQSKQDIFQHILDKIESFDKVYSFWLTIEISSVRTFKQPFFLQKKEEKNVYLLLSCVFSLE